MICSRNTIDIVIPVFNGAQTIAKALEGVFQQDETCLGNIIIVNDGSTDETLEVLSHIKHPKLRVLSTKNQGVAAARNFGIEHATAKWIAFLDADDTWSSDKLKIQLDSANQHQASFVCCSVGSNAFNADAELSQYSLFRGNFIATSSVLMTRDLAQDLMPLFNTQMKFAEDYLAWLKVLCKAPGYYISIPLVQYHVSTQPHYHPIDVLRNLWHLELSATRYLFGSSLGFIKGTSSWLAFSFGVVLSGASIIKRYLKSL
ncbi:glycosyltransferase family 2 protein [Polynucleobacter paneuropaeus]|uniref:glycosyltransferase family 2 protein n=1 Tax=Polynucleobacter paneuropaeus TaxID=2527775 RepID=UPI001313D88B|nr:glycosyltransferase family 2 protein [Polynucleobacter paneuropaeus]